ncbi:DUF645 family protein [Vibrio cholerae]|nr:DUF645 family protein [Vibrio cholerae]
MKTSKPRCFNAVGCSTLKVWFHKRLHHRCDLAFFVADLNRGQLNLDRFEFWQPTSQLLALDVCLCDAFA